MLVPHMLVEWNSANKQTARHTAPPQTN